MSDDVEGARKSELFLAIGTEPDYCWTPVGGKKKLVPYVIACDLSASVDCSPNVLFTDQPAFLFRTSSAPRVKGNEPGVGGGLTSGVNVGCVWVQGHAEAVFINGIAAVRDGDECWMNHPPKP
jgi:hypothetical protein